MADLLNSSDQEFDEDENPYKHLGGRSIAKMDENAVEYRMQSKAGLKKLNNTHNKSRTEAVNRHQALWGNRFDAFFTINLGKSPDQVPTPDDVLRFFVQLPSILGPNRLHARDAYLFACFLGGAKAVRDHVFYKHSSAVPVFRNSNFSARIRSLLNTQAMDGILTKDPVREKQWLSSHLLAKMCRAVLLDAVDHGTRSWDYSIQAALLLALMCGTVARIGDLLRTYDKGNSFVAWQDITLKLITEDDGGGSGPQEVLTAQVNLRFTKGKKMDPNRKPLSHRFRPLHPQYASACVIRLLLTHALRIGTIAGGPASLDDVLKGMRRSPGKTLRWRTPEGPLFMRPDNRNKGNMLVPGDPISSRFRKKALVRAAEVLGLPVTNLVAHDTRRGGAKDVARLSKEQLPNYEISAARRALGHSNKSANIGVTDDYTGGEINDHYTARMRNADAATADDFALDGTLRHAPYVRPQKLEPAQITQFCEDQGWDPLNHLERHRAGRTLRKAHKARWVEFGDQDHDENATLSSDAFPGQQGVPNKRPRLMDATPPVQEQEEPASPRSAAVPGATLPPRSQDLPFVAPVTAPDSGTWTSPTPHEYALPPGEEQEEQVQGAGAGYGDDDHRARSLEYPPPPGEEDDEDESFADSAEAFVASTAEAAQAAGLVGIDCELEGGTEETGSPAWEDPSSTTSESMGVATGTGGTAAPFLVTSGDTEADGALRSHVVSSSISDFISCLARVNVVTVSSAIRRNVNDLSKAQGPVPAFGAKTLAEHRAVLGYPTAKDLPKQVRYRCSNYQGGAGCLKTFIAPNDARDHIGHCPLSTEVKETFICPEEGCGAKLTGKDSLSTHLRNHRDKVGKFQDYRIMCRLPDCDGGPYQNPAAVRNHLFRIHGFTREVAMSTEQEWSAITTPTEAPEDEPADQQQQHPPGQDDQALVTGFPKLCPLVPAECDSTYVYKDRNALRAHFTKRHKMSAKEATAKTHEFNDVPHLPVVYELKRSMPSTYNKPCQMPGCKRGDKPFPNANCLLKHLNTVHKMAWADAKEREKEWSRSNQGDSRTAQDLPQQE